MNLSPSVYAYDLNSAKWPLPWHRHNASIVAHNGAIVAHLPPEKGTDLIFDGIPGIVERGDIIEGYTDRHSRRRNDWLEKRVASLEAALAQSVAHFDSIIGAEGGEFSNGAFDSVKDSLEEWRNLLPKPKETTP